MLKNVNGNNFNDEVIKNNRCILVDFYATWCPPCKMLAPVLEKISSSRADFDIAKVNIDENQKLAMDYKIDVVPTMVVFKDGRAVDKISGYMEEDKIVDFMSKYVE